MTSNFQNRHILAFEYLCTNPACNHHETKIFIPQPKNKTLKYIKKCPECSSIVELVNKILDIDCFLCKKTFNSNIDLHVFYMKNKKHKSVYCFCENCGNVIFNKLAFFLLDQKEIYGGDVS